MKVDESTSIAEILRAAEVERYAQSAHDALEFIRHHYWERAGVDWERLEREWRAING